ncbi:class I SAM-dependent DNA methyltransferase [Donghicola mangrovi]|uniref:Methyltransferase domain-containing protein n=1 Tax=Donghicola mangrovi TaxID=2729614 RepID=A0A850Q777_9RHOB|nr:methyltransferase domain-containing protein [Donghicola mangrovi]NVO24022.1 methyltransferase domain-containing protein [Donghicola mangrovi]
MIPVSMSSGDLIADRRADFAEAMLPDDPAAASDLYAQALQIAPAWAAGWYRLGDIRATAGLPDADTAFEAALSADPTDRLGASLRLDLLRERSLADSMPPAFVEALFDQYAAKFEKSLVGKLDYCGPDLIAGGLTGRFDRVLDMGCGTGLMGQQLRPMAGWLEGWDISTEMLREARTKGVYDALAKRDLATLDLQVNQWDLITAADVFIYVGSLEQIVGWVSQALNAGGQFAFTVEEHTGQQAYVLRDSCRYAHARHHLEDLLDEAGFDARFSRAVLRQDRDQPVWALIVHATKRQPGQSATLRRQQGEEMDA